MQTKVPYKVLITTSGTGSRLGDITKYTNKSLVKVGKKPAISYVIESYPKNVEFIITIGYFGDQVRDFLKLVYPERNFTFVEVDTYEGEGSSLGYSMLQASPQLRCPFIYHACDTIVTGKIPAPKKNWIGGFRGEGSSQYASFDVVDNRVQTIYDKGTLEPDYLHIGLIGINDYSEFWNTLSSIYKKSSRNTSLNDVHVIRGMIADGQSFEVVDFKTWYDIGNVESLHKARTEISDSFRVLDKVDESILIFEKFVVKFFYDEKTVSQRVAREKFLRGLVPEIQGFAKNFYRYKYAKGQLYSKVATPNDFVRFLEWSKKKLWLPNREASSETFHKICHDFYYTKTVERVEKFLKTRSINDSENIINGEKVPTVKEMLNMIDFKQLCSAEQSGFHGDFILDNILKNKSTYILLDWRQNFGGLLKSGDIHYDLAKLNHNLTINHEIINDNLFTITIEKEEVFCDILRKENLIECQQTLFDFMSKNGYSKKRVKILTALIWLNMSPLHHHPFDLFLFYFGKLQLWKAIKSDE